MSIGRKCCLRRGRVWWAELRVPVVVRVHAQRARCQFDGWSGNRSRRPPQLHALQFKIKICDIHTQQTTTYIYGIQIVLCWKNYVWISHSFSGLSEIISWFLSFWNIIQTGAFKKFQLAIWYNYEWDGSFCGASAGRRAVRQPDPISSRPAKRRDACAVWALLSP